MLLELDALDLRFADLRVRDVARSQRMRASVAMHGQLSPVVVVAEDVDGERRHVLIDGYERVSALAGHAVDVVHAVVIDAPLVDALVMSRRLDECSDRSALEEGWMLDLLVREHGLVQRDLATRLGRSPSWVSRRLSLVQTLPAEVQRAVRDGRVPAHAAEKYFVPLARAKRSSCIAMVTALGRETLRDRDVQQLYEAWRAGSAATRAEIEANPRLVLRVCERRAAESAGETERLCRDLDAISATARRAHERGLLRAVDRTRPRLMRAFAEARRAFSTLSNELEGDTPDARPRPANDHSADAK